MLMAAIMPALESAPRTVSRRQPPGAEPCALSPRAGIERGHRRGNAALVEEDQVLGVELPHPFAEDRPLRLDVGAIALAGAQRLFLCHSPSRRGARHRVGRLTGGPPLRTASSSLYSSSVRSFRSATRARKIASPAVPIPRARPPPCGLAQRRPYARAC